MKKMYVVLAHEQEGKPILLQAFMDPEKANHLVAIIMKAGTYRHVGMQEVELEE